MTADQTIWTPPSPQELQPFIRDYEILALIGKGGMGAVYQVRHCAMGRLAAIKILPLGPVDDLMGNDFRHRFQQEALALAKMQHPSIVTVYGCGEAGDASDGSSLLYLVMEYIEGCDILQFLNDHAEKRLPPEDALAITCHVLDGLAYAHGKGVLHLDIKPANVLLDLKGRVRIVDFGLAMHLAPGDEDIFDDSEMAMGTPDYVAPEILEYENRVDHRADLYSVGVMLYQMLTGKLPKNNHKSPSELVPELDWRYDRIVEKAMQRDPGDRYANALDFRIDLDPLLLVPHHAPVGKMKKNPARVEKLPWVRGCVAHIGATLFGTKGVRPAGKADPVRP